MQIAKKFGNLKSTCQRGIAEAVASLRQAVFLLSIKSRSEETKRLEEEVRALQETNLGLARDITSVKKKMKAMEREERRRRRAVDSESSSPSPPRRRRKSSSVLPD